MKELSKERDLITRSNGLISDITNYIYSIHDWIFYFLNPLAGGNDGLFDCIKEHLDDWECYVDFEICNISGSNVQIKIHIDDYTDCGITLIRFINLFNFEETVKRNKMLYDGETCELRKKSIKEDITRLKEALQKKEEELNKLNSL